MDTVLTAGGSGGGGEHFEGGGEAQIGEHLCLLKVAQIGEAYMGEHVCLAHRLNLRPAFHLLTPALHLPPAASVGPRTYPSSAAPPHPPCQHPPTAQSSEQHALRLLKAMCQCANGHQYGRQWLGLVYTKGFESDGSGV